MKRRASRPLILAAAATAAAMTSPAFAQLRIISLNGANTLNQSSGTSVTGPRNGTGMQRHWMDEILSGLGAFTSDDPTIAGNSGIHKAPDVLCLQEVNSAATTAFGYRQRLNALYPGSNYQWVNVNGASSDPNPSTQGLVYNANALTLIQQFDSGTMTNVDALKIGTSSGSGQPRQALLYKLRPVGYDSSADIYIFNSHYKSSDDTTSEGRRLLEAQAIRTAADGLGAGKNIIYLGDMNVYRNTDPFYQHLLSAGNGQAIDPINKPGNWNNDTTFKNIDTQSPFSSATAVALGTSFSGSTGGMDDRFDQQLITANLNDAHGVAYIPNSYTAFGNNGTHTFNSPINSAGNTALNSDLGTTQAGFVRDDLAAILDHLPVVADYQLPAKLSVSVASVPGLVITGGTVNLNVTVSNAPSSALVSFANGADTLNYSMTSSGDISGSASGSDAALGGSNVHAVALSTTGTGAKSGSISVTSTSEAVANNNFSQNVDYVVLNHASASFENLTNVSSQSIDFGYVPLNSATRSSPFSIFNQSGALRAGLDLDSVNASGDTDYMYTDVSGFANLVAGSSLDFNAYLDATATGVLSATHTFGLSDQDLPGAAATPNLVVTTNARVFDVATFPVTGYMYLPEEEPLNTGPFSIAAAVTLTKNGPGTMTIDGTQSNGAGSQLVVEEGTVNFNTDAGPTSPTLGVTANPNAVLNFNATQHLASLELIDATAALSAGGNKVLVTNSFTATVDSRLDLTNNDMVIRTGSLGTWNGSTYTGVTGLIKSGRNGGGWGGNGIVTSQSNATGGSYTTLGVSTASAAKGIAATATAVWNGQTVTGSDVLVMYTYGGDANLDGVLNIGDYGRIDTNIALPVMSRALSFANGDFNYDGLIDIGDYGILDVNIAIQGPSLGSGAGSGGVAPVPEPAGAMLALLTAAALGSRRRRP